MKQNTRLRELDFLRGIAIILVLMRHQQLFDFTSKMGWIGVDLFFVLSGFLVSGLLFKEYLKFGNIKPGLFLIRRAFKIYPIYYLTYFLYLIPKIIKHQFEWSGLFSDLFFVQNYVYGWGYANVPSWSLAVEEHFYFGFALLLWSVIKYKWIDLKQDLAEKISKFEIVIFVIMIACLALRLISNVYFQGNGDKNFTMSHLRMDSLLAGVLVSYLYYFKREKLSVFFNSKKYLLMFLSISLILFTPFIDFEESFFVRTFGFSFLYISFAILLVHFLLDKDINKKLNRVFSRQLVDIISKIGFSSYSIYIIHSFINFLFNLINNFVLNNLLGPMISFFITSIMSVLVGLFMTFKIEKFFLNYREKYFSNRIN
ncbi:acyltransferase family protein [Flavobacterium geliluteum]|uniref:Acyltransferase n=1 Tax=Flavobacterium geliluteum TaxID=2816120 RepID=A0A941AYI8_9FLAO|nr:acyltransferase [Flavobacterium geliluteum]MBP4137832.1 acyltransferase [Flavobacterium geliluteum]